MSAKLKIRRGDEVIVLTGKDKGKKGSVTQVFPKDSRALVSGINVAKRHQKPSQMGPGGIVNKELPIHVSNLALVDPKDGKATRVGYKIEKDGTKTRISRRSGQAIEARS